MHSCFHDALCLQDALRRAEQLFGAQEAIVCGELRLTYAEFAARCRRLVTLLHQLGVQRGDRVAVLMPNSHRYLEAYCAIPALGAVIVPLNNRHTAAEQRATLQDAGATLLIVDTTFAEIANALEMPALALLFAPEPYEGLLAACTEGALDDKIEADALAALFYTSGTTGQAKGVMLTHRNLVANAFHITVAFGYRESDTFLHMAPLFHLADAGSVHALIWLGARHVILPKFDPGAALDLMARERVTCTLGVPAMLYALVNHPHAGRRDLRSLRLIAHGGAPITRELLRRVAATFDCSLTQAYGLTEASSFAGVLPHEECLLDSPLLRAAGRAAMGVQLVVRRADGTPCAAHEVGEITGRGPNFMVGYWRRPDQTARALRDGWFWTGDLAYADEQGYLYIVDRAKDMIISGGENVYSAEVEAVVATHPAVAEVAVIGVADARWGERVHAVVALRAGRQLDVAELRAFCREQLADYKCPRSLSTVDALPKSGAGKILKHKLREEQHG